MNKHNRAVIVRTYVIKNRDKLAALLKSYRELPTLEAAIGWAALGLNARGRRHRHQRWLDRKALERAKERLVALSKRIGECGTFDELHGLIQTNVQGIKGLKELYMYDTALRIGARLCIYPEKVYLHRGTRDGAIALGFEPKLDFIEKKKFPIEFQFLTAYEIEDLLCIYKDRLG